MTRIHGLRNGLSKMVAKRLLQRLPCEAQRNRVNLLMGEGLYPGSVIERLHHDLMRRLVALQFQRHEVRLAVKGQQVYATAGGRRHTPPDEQHVESEKDAAARSHAGRRRSDAAFLCGRICQKSGLTIAPMRSAALFVR